MRALNFRHCEEGDFPDEAISTMLLGIASQRMLAMTDEITPSPS
jgi:hypothetical protein